MPRCSVQVDMRRHLWLGFCLSWLVQSALALQMLALYNVDPSVGGLQQTAFQQAAKGMNSSDIDIAYRASQVTGLL